jgi:hypothetical protein
MLRRRPHHDDADWRQYACTIDAITTRRPHRMSPNGMDMLRAKVWQIRDGELRNDAWEAYYELEDKMKEVA